MKRIATIILVCLTAAFVFCAHAETCGDWKYVVLEDDTLCLTQYTGKEEILDVPAAIDGRTVTMLDANINNENSYNSIFPADIKEIALPDTIRTIGSHAFEGMINLTRLELNSGLAYVHQDAFIQTDPSAIIVPEDYPAWHYRTLEDGTMCLTAYVGVETHVVTPQTIGGVPVTMLDGNTHYDANSFRTDSVFGVTVEEVVVSEGVTHIEAFAFRDCFALRSVTLPDSLTYMGSYAFEHCESLERVHGGKNLQNQSVRLFDGAPTTVALTGGFPVWRYHVLEGGTLCISQYCGAELDVTVPAEIDGVPVTHLAPFFSPDNSSGWGIFSQDVNSVTLPEGITHIGSNAFAYLTDLEQLTIPSSVTHIAYGAFEGSDNLKLVTQFDGVVSITSASDFPLPMKPNDPSETPAPPKPSAWKYEVLADGTASLSYYSGSETDLVVPATIDGYTVTRVERARTKLDLPLERVVLPDTIREIGEFAFDQCSTLREVIIPEGVTVIGRYAFRNCTSLESITLPDSLQTIDEFAFGGCSALQAINWPASLTTIDEYAFEGCSSLKSFHAPAGLRTIGDGAFRNCTSLADVQLNEGLVSVGHHAFYKVFLAELDLPSTVVLAEDDVILSPHYLEYSNDTWKWGVDGSSSVTLLKYLGKKTSVTVPSDMDGMPVIAIGKNCFESTNVTTVKLPDTIRAIHENAFTWCKKLTTINLPNGLESIGKSAFYSCQSLTRIVIPDSVTTIGSDTFYGCQKLSSVTLPKGMTEIPDCMFYSTNLSKISIPDSVKRIGKRAFFYCDKLKSITLPVGLERIEESAFQQTNISSITIPESVEYIGRSAMSTGVGKFVLKSVTFYGYDCEIAEEAFYARNMSYTYGTDASKLTVKCHAGSSIDQALQYNVKKVYPKLNDYEPVTAPADPVLKAGLYKGRTDVVNLVIPEGVTEIEPGAFRDLVCLRKVTLPSTLTALPDELFYGCISLTDVEIPESVTSIGRYTFRDCESLVSVTLPEGLLSLGEGAFQSSTSLTSAKLPAGLKELGPAVFYACTNITKPTFPDGITEIPAGLYYGCSFTALTIPEGVTSIGANAFGMNFDLNKLQLPSTLKTIGAAAFECHYNTPFGVAANDELTTIVIPEGVESIGDRAFRGCVSLKKLTLPKSLRSIGFAAFNGNKLKTLVIPDGVETIGGGAFASSELTKITLPASVTSIGTEAFHYAGSKVTVTCPEGSDADRYIKENYPDFKLSRPQKK